MTTWVAASRKSHFIKLESGLPRNRARRQSELRRKMSNRIHVKLDALASTVEEINKIEPALKKPCEELVTWVAERDGQDPKKIAENLKTLVAFTPTANLGAVDPLLKDRKSTRLNSSHRC